MLDFQFHLVQSAAETSAGEIERAREKGALSQILIQPFAYSRPLSRALQERESTMPNFGGDFLFNYLTVSLFPIHGLHKSPSKKVTHSIDQNASH
jgi:hypothetical protein